MPVICLFIYEGSLKFERNHVQFIHCKAAIHIKFAPVSCKKIKKFHGKTMNLNTDGVCF